MMRRAAVAFRWPFVVVPFIFCCGALGAAKQAEEVSPSEPAEAYLALVRGDTAREAGNDAAAIVAYEDALLRYERIARIHPDWESDIVRYRIRYCRQQLEAARARLSGRSPATLEEKPSESSEPVESVETAAVESAAETPAITTAPSVPEPTEIVEEEPRMVGASSQEVEYLRMRVTELLDQVVQLEAELDAKSNEAASTPSQAELEAARGRAEKAEARARELENEVRRLSRALAERETPSAKEREDAEFDARYTKQLRDALRRERERDFRGALAVYEQIRKKRPSDRSALLGQARCLFGMAQVEKALALLEKVEGIEHDEQALVLQGAGLGMLGRYAEVIARLQPRVEEGTDNAWIYNLLGAAQLAQGRSEEARRTLEKAIALDSTLGEAYYNLAVLTAEEKRRGGATNDLAEIRELYRKSVELGALAEPELEHWLKP